MKGFSTKGWACGMLTAAALLAVAGCSSTTKYESGASDAKTQTDMSSSSGYYAGAKAKKVETSMGTAQPAPAPAPKPAPAPAKVAEAPKPAPAPAPAPAKVAEAPKPAPAPAPAPAGSSSSVMYLPTGDRHTSALMIEERLPSGVRQGQPFDADVIVTNLSNNTLQNVQVSADSFKNFDVQSATPMWNKTANGGVWNLGDLGPGKSQTIKVKGVANASGIAGNCLSANWNNSLCVTTNVTQPALAITKAVTPAEGTPCDTFTYTIEVKNTGSGSADNVHIKDMLPAGTTLASGGNSIDDAIGTLGAGQTAHKTYTVKSAKSGTYQNSAQAVADGGLTASSNTVTHVVKQASIALTCEAPANLLIGRNLTYKLTVKNNGDGGCGNVTITSPNAAGLTFVNAEGGQSGAGGVSWNLGALGPGQSKTVSATFKSSGAGTIPLSAKATCPCSADATANCSVVIQGVPDIGTGIEDDDGVVQVGDTHVYKFTVVNQGQVDLTNVKVVGTLDDGSDFVSSTWPAGQQVSGKVITWQVGTVPVGQRKSFNITIKGMTPGEHGIETVTTSNELKRVVRNDEQVTYVEK